MAAHRIYKPTTVRALAWVYGPTLVILLIAGTFRARGSVSTQMLFRDPVQSADLPFYAGMMSHLGIVLWTVAAAVSLFAGALLLASRARREAMLLLGGGMYTSVLLADDLFVLHEVVFPGLLGIAEHTVFGCYALGLVALLWAFRTQWRQTEYLLLFGALGWFALSLLLDLMPAHDDERWQYLAEDGAKFMGIAHWCAFFVRTSYDRLDAALPRRRVDVSALAPAASSILSRHGPAGAWAGDEQGEMDQRLPDPLSAPVPATTGRVEHV